MATKRELLASATATPDEGDKSVTAVIAKMDEFAQREFSSDADSAQQTFNQVRHAAWATGPHITSLARFDRDGNEVPKDTKDALDFGKFIAGVRAKRAREPMKDSSLNSFASMVNTAIAGAENNANLVSTLDSVFAAPDPEKKIVGGAFYQRKAKVKTRRLVGAAYALCRKAKTGDRDMKLNTPAIINDCCDEPPKATREDGDKLRSVLKTLTLYVNGNAKAVPPVAPIAEHDLWVAALGAVELACSNPEATPQKIVKPAKPTKSGKPRKPKVVSNVETLQNMALLSVAQVEAWLKAQKNK